MSTKTSIEWADATWNPIRGCSRVSEGCRNCYAERDAHRFGGAGKPFAGLTSIVNGKPVWNGTIRFVENHLLDPLKWRTPRRIFVNSMSDLFHENVTDAMLDRIFAVMALCPQHTFQVLTKRPERMRAYLGDSDPAYPRALAIADSFADWHNMPEAIDIAISKAEERRQKRDASPSPGHIRLHWPLPNVWLGVSVENQKAANERIPLLLQTTAAKRFISAEPLLGGVDLTNINAMVWFAKYMASINPHEAMRQANSDLYPKHCSMDALTGSCVAVEPELQERLDWVIVGGESGPGARPMHPDWARSLRDQCVAAGVPFFFKQWGEWSPFATRFASDHEERQPWDSYINLDGSAGHAALSEDGLISNWTGHMQEGLHFVSRVGKKVAGRLLDGREWNEVPA